MDGGDDGDVVSGRVGERTPARIIDDILWASAPLVP
jgi:hypothetical protein